MTAAKRRVMQAQDLDAASSVSPSYFIQFPCREILITCTLFPVWCVRINAATLTKLPHVQNTTGNISDIVRCPLYFE